MTQELNYSFLCGGEHIVSGHAPRNLIVNIGEQVRFGSETDSQIYVVKSKVMRYQGSYPVLEILVEPITTTRESPIPDQVVVRLAKMTVESLARLLRKISRTGQEPKEDLVDDIFVKRANRLLNYLTQLMPDHVVHACPKCGEQTKEILHVWDEPHKTKEDKGLVNSPENGNFFEPISRLKHEQDVEDNEGQEG